MAKQLMFDQEARAAILKGVNVLTDAVKATLGPKGRNVMIDKKFGAPTITKDGVTVAKEVELKDPMRTWAPSSCAKWPPRPRRGRRRHHDGDGAGPGDSTARA